MMKQISTALFLLLLSLPGRSETQAANQEVVAEKLLFPAASSRAEGTLSSFELKLTPKNQLAKIETVPQSIAAAQSEKSPENIVQDYDFIQDLSNDAIENSSAYNNATTYSVHGKNYHTLSAAQTKQFSQEGRASWYGPGFHGRRTAMGTKYDMYAMTAAHRQLPLGTKVQVTNKQNGKSVVVTINDRGPFHGHRILDLSKAAASKLGVVKTGTADVRLTVLK